MKGCSPDLHLCLQECVEAHSNSVVNSVADFMETSVRKRRRDRQRKKSFEEPKEERGAKVQNQQTRQPHICSVCLATIMGYRSWKQHIRRCGTPRTSHFVVPVPEASQVRRVAHNMLLDEMVFASEAGAGVAVASGGPTLVEDTPAEVMGVMLAGGGNATLDEVNPAYGLWVRGERQRERRLEPEVLEERVWGGGVKEFGNAQGGGWHAGRGRLRKGIFASSY